MSRSTYRVTFTPGERCSMELIPLDVTEAELTELLSTTKEGQKDGLAIIPAVFRPCPKECRGTGIDCGGGQLHRLAANVAEMTMFAVDIDHAPTREQFDAVIRRLNARGLRLWWWETFSSTPAAFRGRVLLPFDVPVPLVSPNQWKFIAWPALMKRLGFADQAVKADDTCKNADRVYFTPRAPVGGRPREAGFLDGVPLDWRALLAESLDAFQRAAVPVAVRPRAAANTLNSVSQEAIGLVRAALHAYAGHCPDEKRLPLQRLLGGMMPGDLPNEVRLRARNSVWLDVLWALAKVAPDEIPSDALMELIVRPAWEDEVRAATAAGVEFTEWETLEDMLERARPKASVKRAQDAAERQAFAGRWSESPAARKAVEQARRRLSRSGGGK